MPKARQDVRDKALEMLKEQGLEYLATRSLRPDTPENWDKIFEDSMKAAEFRQSVQEATGCSLQVARGATSWAYRQIRTEQVRQRNESQG